MPWKTPAEIGGPKELKPQVTYIGLWHPTMQDANTNGNAPCTIWGNPPSPLVLHQGTRSRVRVPYSWQPATVGKRELKSNVGDVSSAPWQDILQWCSCIYQLDVRPCSLPICLFPLICAPLAAKQTSAQIVGCFLGFVTICWQSILKNYDL